MRGRVMAAAAVCAGLVCAACTPAGAPRAGRSASPPAITGQVTAHLGQPTVLARHLAVPWAIAFLPDGDALVTERDRARLLRVTPGGQVTVVGTVPGVAPYGEGGLLGVAVSPSFRQDHLVYLYLSTGTDNRIVRFDYSGGHVGPLHAVLTGIPRAAIHNGGRLAFGPDGMLWASTGEHGQPQLAQDPKSLGGKILRMTPAGRPAPGNPFGTVVWSYGHRNVEGLAWDSAGRLYATEFGQDHLDEVNRIEKGHNYGWPVLEGAGSQGRYTDPGITWAPDQASPAGAAISAGSLWVAALRGERLWQIPLGPGAQLGTPVAHVTAEYGRLRAVVCAPDGSLWVTTSNLDGRGDRQPDGDLILIFPLR